MVQHRLEQIEAHDKQGLNLNAVSDYDRTKRDA